MSLVAWYAVLGAVQATLALWVIFAHPRRALNWAVGTLLILWSASGVTFQLWRDANGGAGGQPFRIIGNLYEAPTFLLVLLIVDRLWMPARRPRWWSALLLAGFGALLFFWAEHASATVEDQRLFAAITNASLQILAQIVAVVFAARVASDARRSVVQRRQAALFGLAFALLVVQSSTAGLALLVQGTLLNGMSAFLPIAGLAAGAYGFARLPSPFQARPRLVMRSLLVFAVLMGLGSYGAVPALSFVGGRGGRAVVLSAFSMVLAVAVLRYDLAVARAADRKRLQTVAAILLGVCVAAIFGAGAWSLWGESSLTLVVGLAALAAPAALLVTPLKRLPAWVTRRVLLDPRDPAALRERVRVYAGTLRAATGPDGRPLPAAEPALAALRAQLGLGQRDHDLLVAMGGDQSAGGIVAYRLALVGAAADAEKLDEAQLARLRDELSISERDHALVIEHVEAGADQLSAGALFLGRYHILRRLGEGGLGEVWLARDTREGVDVVLKHVAGEDRRDAVALQRIHREVRAAVVEHPNVVAVRGVEMVGGEAYLVMEHMEGGSLADALREKGRLPEEDVLRIATGVLDALGALHARGFVHRDVKPANILLDAKGVAKLGDFNVARDLVSGETLGGAPRGPVGTFAYMPLEQARGHAARPPSDLYALGATMYEAIAGAPLLDVVGLSHTEAIARLAAQEPPIAVPHASARVSAAIVRALARSPDDRFASAADMRAVLVAATTISPPGTREGSVPRR